ncbi:nucleoside triphosphate pyrophosphohydrolase MazG [Legionella lansingensis]|uniref:Nucleoside triphosphate pyrophosphohydrolase MazG n=1 Tax=Legionella lansingensis TaxID=45067 RepID=A0A0W0V789_9GAMM|nr:MazG nucleotide pyrophosphohydrolase domain-containing protein [Legionella lansingensis]KTD15966.1 nucleoside triphosphate pyrophosphohydrolase MazG [Legionella lansingensis]SNV56645.1 nucleoside triphosphate pyrophosphohydrolase MazG [Legionella lansingensis]
MSNNLTNSPNNPLKTLIAVEEDARHFGFEWPNEEMIIDQAISECDEIRAALKGEESRERLQEEIGDLLHTAISLCIFAGFEPEETLAKITKKFNKRILALKEIANTQGFSTLKHQPIELLMELWQQAKQKSR